MNNQFTIAENNALHTIIDNLFQKLGSGWRICEMKKYYLALESAKNKLLPRNSKIKDNSMSLLEKYIFDELDNSKINFLKRIIKARKLNKSYYYGEDSKFDQEIDEANELDNLGLIIVDWETGLTQLTNIGDIFLQQYGIIKKDNSVPLLSSEDIQLMKRCSSRNCDNIRKMNELISKLQNGITKIKDNPVPSLDGLLNIYKKFRDSDILEGCDENIIIAFLYYIKRGNLDGKSFNPSYWGNTEDNPIKERLKELEVLYKLQNGVETEKN